MHKLPAKRFGLLSYERALFAIQAALDWLTVTACYLLAYWIYVRLLHLHSPQKFLGFALLSGVIAMVYVLILDRVGMYRGESSLLNIAELRGVFRTGLYAGAVILSSSFYIRSLDLSRITFTIAIIITPVLLYIQRQLFYRVQLALHFRGYTQRRILIFGAGDIGRNLAKRLFESPSLGMLPVGFLDDGSEKHGQFVSWRGPRRNTGLTILGGEDQIRGASKRGVDLVLIALPSASFERNQKLVELCIEEGLEYAIVPNAYEKFIENLELFQIGGIPILRRRVRRVSLYYLFLKRVVDFTLATAFLAVLSPLIIFFAVAIKLDSKGPIIFKQKRVGYRGRQFSFYKFRTMYLDAPKYARSPADPKDPRITPIGRWLRRTSLDELPQLFNVFRGDMSLVGPRPEMPFIVEQYTPLQRLRLDAKPGITGVWQISAVRGEPIHANIEYDLFYLQNRSLLLDLAVIVKTILSVIKGVGAV